MALGSAWGRVSWLYYQYLLVTALYMLEPWERTVFMEVSYSLAMVPGSIYARSSVSEERTRVLVAP